MKENELKGKVAVVTGSSRGIGRGIAVGLGEKGATVYITGRSTDTGTPTPPASLTILAVSSIVKGPFPFDLPVI